MRQLLDSTIARLRWHHEKSEPVPADFDGSRLARERNYRGRNLQGGLDTFARRRAENLATLEATQSHEWAHPGTQDLMEPVCLGDVPRMMAEHDATHRGELEELRKAISSTQP